MKNEEIIEHEIICGAKKLMQQFGLKKTTMEDIAKAVGKSKSTLYYYFKDKEEIFDRVINLEMDELFQTIKSSVDRQADAIGMLKAYMVTKLKTLRDKTNLYRFAIEEDFQGRLNNEFTNLRTRYDGEEKKLLELILSKGVTDNLFTSEIKIEIELLSELLVSCIRGIEVDVISNKKYRNLEEKAGVLVDFLIKGIGK